MTYCPTRLSLPLEARRRSPRDSSRNITKLDTRSQDDQAQERQGQVGEKMTFEGGVLEMKCAYALRTDGMFSDNENRELLVAKL